MGIQLDYNQVMQKPAPVYVSEQIDQLILTPEARSTIITKKKPRIVRHPIYLLDENGEKIPLRDEKNNLMVNEDGEVKYIIKDYTETRDGWEAAMEIVPASEIFYIDNATSNISHDAVQVLLRMYWFYNYLTLKHLTTDNDYSIYLHKLRNDAISILQASKSFNGGTVQAIKTFINKTDAKQWTNEDPQNAKKDFFSGLFGGNKKAKPEEKEYTAFKS